MAGQTRNDIKARLKAAAELKRREEEDRKQNLADQIRKFHESRPLPTAEQTIKDEVSGKDKAKKESKTETEEQLKDAYQQSQEQTELGTKQEALNDTARQENPYFMGTISISSL